VLGFSNEHKVIISRKNPPESTTMLRFAFMVVINVERSLFLKLFYV